MKRIVFKIAKSFCACFITLLFFSCSNSESVMEKERKSTVIIDIKQLLQMGKTIGKHI